MFKKLRARNEISKSQKIIDKILSNNPNNLTAEDFWNLKTARANKRAFEEYLKGGLQELPHSLYNLPYKKLYIEDAFNPSELESLLNQLKDPKTGKIASEGDIREAINSFIKTRGPLDVITKAQTTDNLLDQLIAHIADKEMSPILGNDFDINPENLRKIREHQLPGIFDVKKPLGLKSDITFVLPPLSASGIYNPEYGFINLNPYLGSEYPNKAFKKAMRRFGLGTFFHEGSHDIDEINQRIAISRNELNKKNNPPSLDVYDKGARHRVPGIRNIVNDPKQKEFVESFLNAVENYEKQNPGKVDTDKDILKFSGEQVASPIDFIKEPNINKMDAIDLQNFYNRGKGRSHFFKRNFAFESLLNALDKGVKGVKTIAPVLSPVAKVVGKVGLPLAAAYSNYSEASEMGLPKPLAAAYAGAEELNPLPISGIDYYKGIEKAAEGRAKNIAQNYITPEEIIEQKALENYADSPAAKHRAFNKLRELLNGYMLDENVPQKKMKS